MSNDEASDIKDMKMIYKTAKLICWRIAANANNGLKHSIPVPSTTDDIPVELYTLLHWIMIGPEEGVENRGEK